MENSKKKKAIIYSSVFILVIILIILLCRSCLNKNVTSFFNQDDEGWRIIGDAQKGDANPDFLEKDGAPGGFISADDDATGGVWYWNAPEKFLGDKSAAYGKKLKFSLKQSSTDNQFDADDVVFIGKDVRMAFDLSENPGIDWTEYTVPLDENAGWKLNSSSGSEISKDAFMDILSNLQAIQIRGEYVVGEDTGGLDTVVLYMK
jgi:alkaline phosphatase D